MHADANIFATDCMFRNDGSQVTDCGTAMVSPADPAMITYGRAIVEGVDVARGKSGHVTALEDVVQGGFLRVASAINLRLGATPFVIIRSFDNSFADAITRAAFNRDLFAASDAMDADMNVMVFAWPSLSHAIATPIPWADYLFNQTMAGQSRPAHHDLPCPPAAIVAASTLGWHAVPPVMSQHGLLRTAGGGAD